LPRFQTAYAVTVHKAQGSEFSHITAILGDTPSPLVTRELLYTAITRSRRTLEIWASASVLDTAFPD
jgi:exodeoxyribonuclease V alpha subunit